VTAFLAALPRELVPRYAALADLEAALTRLVEAAGVTDPTTFLRELAVRLDPDDEPAGALAAVRASELALALACLRGEPEALARFDAELSDVADAAHARFRGIQLSCDDLRQVMRERLLVGSPPRIASYRGKGPLRGWLRIATVRYLVDTQRSEAARPDRLVGDEPLLATAASIDDPEIAFLKDRYRDEFKTAFAAAVGQLDARSRNMLRHRYVNGLDVAALARIYGLHRVSLSRALARIRGDVLGSVREHFRRHLGVSPAELDSLMNLIGSRLELSLSGLLRD
jgi:RNA polymerase sigma-70 factor (ECF subfamily)